MLQNTMTGLYNLIPTFKLNEVLKNAESVYVTVFFWSLGFNTVLSTVEAFSYNKGNLLKMFRDKCYSANLFFGVVSSIIWPVMLPLYIIDSSYKIHNNFTK